MISKANAQTVRRDTESRNYPFYGVLLTTANPTKFKYQESDNVGFNADGSIKFVMKNEFSVSIDLDQVVLEEINFVERTSAKGKKFGSAKVFISGTVSPDGKWLNPAIIDGVMQVSNRKAYVAPVVADSDGVTGDVDVTPAEVAAIATETAPWDTVAA
jgi:hypothetical protein